MQKNLKLFQVLLGCKPRGRHTEQHDVFFGIATHLKDLIPKMQAFWPEADGKIHIDAWQIVSQVGDFKIEIKPKTNPHVNEYQLFFINLGGYKPEAFEEFHYKVLTVAKTKSEAIAIAKKSVFFKHYSFTNATSHIDDTYGIDVDDCFKIEEILNSEDKKQFQICITPKEGVEDEKHIGYLNLSKIK